MVAALPPLDGSPEAIGQMAARDGGAVYCGRARAAVREAGGAPLEPSYESFAASMIGLGVNQVLPKVGLPRVPVPLVRVPMLDRLAYELLAPARRRF